MIACELRYKKVTENLFNTILRRYLQGGRIEDLFYQRFSSFLNTE